MDSCLTESDRCAFPQLASFHRIYWNHFGQVLCKTHNKVLFSLMGDVVEPRREFIQDYSLNADVVVLLGSCLVGQHISWTLEAISWTQTTDKADSIFFNYWLHRYKCQHSWHSKPDPYARVLDATMASNCRAAFHPNYLHCGWLDYLYWDPELDLRAACRACRAPHKCVKHPIRGSLMARTRRHRRERDHLLPWRGPYGAPCLRSATNSDRVRRLTFRSTPSCSISIVA
jgi:hypothetical protein